MRAYLLADRLVVFPTPKKEEDNDKNSWQSKKIRIAPELIIPTPTYGNYQNYLSNHFSSLRN